MNAPTPITTHVRQLRVGVPRPAGMIPRSLASEVWVSTGLDPADAVDAVGLASTLARGETRAALRALAAEIERGPAVGSTLAECVENAVSVDAWVIAAVLDAAAEEVGEIGVGSTLAILAEAIEDEER